MPVDYKGESGVEPHLTNGNVRVRREMSERVKKYLPILKRIGRQGKARIRQKMRQRVYRVRQRVCQEHYKRERTAHGSSEDDSASQEVRPEISV